MNTENDGQKKRKKRNILNNVEKQQGEKEEEEEDIWRGWRRSGGGVEAEFKGGIKAEKVERKIYILSNRLSYRSIEIKNFQSTHLPN